MSLDLEFKKLDLPVENFVNNSNKVECRVPLTEEESANILKVDAVTYLLSIECADKEIRYSGRAIFTLLYKSEGRVKKFESGVEYSFRFPCEAVSEKMAVTGEISIENPSITHLNGIATASALVTFKGEITTNKEFEYFEKDKNLLIKNQELITSFNLGTFSKESKVEEEFETDELISNVLIHSERVNVESCQCGINSVIVDGDIECTILFEPLNKTLPLSIVKKIPFRSEIDVEGINPNNYASACVCVKGASYKVYVDESKNKSSISIEINLVINGKTYENRKEYPVIDGYSLKREIYFEREKVNLSKINSYKCVDFKVESEISLNEDKNTRLISLLGAKIEEISVSGLDVTGIVSLELLCQGEDFTTQTSILPINYTLPLIGNTVKCFKASISDVNVGAFDGKTAVSFKINLCYLDVESYDAFVITKVAEGEEKPVNDSAISVYIPKPNDSLWDISKELGAKEEEILKLNSDLTFPLTGDERIVVYREVDINK